MKIHTLQIPPEGKHFEGEDPVQVFDLNDNEVQPIKPLSYSLDAGLSDGGLFATGRISSAFQVRCVRCLENFELPVEVPDFACQVELENKEEVDLTEILREDILLALPAHPHCDWNGQRPCSGTPVPERQNAPDEDPKQVWNALDRLKL